VENITEALWGTRVSPNTVSELNQKIYVHIDTWRNRPIEGKYPYVFLDGIWLKRSLPESFEDVVKHDDFVSYSDVERKTDVNAKTGQPPLLEKDEALRNSLFRKALC
jgi:hypothetical protein